MKTREYMEKADEVMARIQKGAFLTVKANGELNTMTIGWATIGHIWRKPVFMVAVRNTRHTFKLLEQTNNFTVTIPAGDEHKNAVMFCGTKSGAEFDKFEECNLQPIAGQKVQTPVIGIPGRHYECSIIYKSAMDNSFLDHKLDAELYAKKDYHTLYFGEILACYEIA